MATADVTKVQPTELKASRCKPTGPKMEWKPMRPSALIMAGLGTVQVLAVMAVHTWGGGLPGEVLSASVVGFLMLLGQSITKLCEDHPAPEAGEDKDITLKRLELEHARMSGPAPAATVTMTEDTMKAMVAKK